MEDRRGIVFLILMTLFMGGCIMVVNIKESPITLKESKTKTQEVNANLKAFNKDREVEKDTIK